MVMLLLHICQRNKSVVVLFSIADDHIQSIFGRKGFFMAFNIFYILFNLNSATNFLLYCASGTKFRRTLKAMFCSKRTSKHANNTTATSVCGTLSATTHSTADRVRNSDEIDHTGRKVIATNDTVYNKDHSDDERFIDCTTTPVCVEDKY
jgi:hypothetical protein